MFSLIPDHSPSHLTVWKISRHLYHSDVCFRGSMSSVQGTPKLQAACIKNFVTCRVSMHVRCHVSPWLTEFSGVVLSSFTLSCQIIFLQMYHQYKRKIRPYRCSRQFFIQGHGSGNFSILHWPAVLSRIEKGRLPSICLFLGAETSASDRIYHCSLLPR